MGLNSLVWLILVLIWGSTWLGIKYALLDLPPISCAVWRFILALIPVYLYMKMRGQRFPTRFRDWLIIAVTGQLTFSLNYGLVFWSGTIISSGLSAVLYALFPIFGMLQSSIFLKSEKITPRRILGTILGVSGVALIFYHQIAVKDMRALIGSGAILVAAFGTAFSGILTKKFLLHIPSAALTAGQMAAGIPSLLLVAILIEPFQLPHEWSLRGWLSMLYLAVLGSALTFCLYNWLITRIELSICNLIPLGSTTIAVWLGWFILGEKLTPELLLGTGLILTGLVTAIRRNLMAVNVTQAPEILAPLPHPEEF